MEKSSGIKICPQRNLKCVSSGYELASEGKQLVKSSEKRDGIVEVCWTKAI